MVLQSGPSAETNATSELSLAHMKAKLQEIATDSAALRGVVFWIALPIVSRGKNPIAESKAAYGIVLKGPSIDDLHEALELLVPEDHPFKAATARLLSNLETERVLLRDNGWDRWRVFDGSEFCNLAQRFFAALNKELYEDELRRLGQISGLEETIERFAEETSVITRTFSARWFNACARFEAPSVNSIRWYLGHCLGKLDLELSREEEGWVEQPRKRRVEQPALDL